MYNSQYNYINQEDFGRIISHIPYLSLRKWSPRTIQMLFKVSYWCGLRMIEARHLNKEQFDLMRHRVYLGKTKTKENDTRPIPVPFIAELSAYLDNIKNGIIDPVPHRKTIEMWCNKIGSELNIEAWTTLQSDSHEKTKGHIFRKSIGKDMLYGTHTGRKAQLPMISQQLGHSDTVTTLKYLRESDQAVQDYWES